MHHAVIPISVLQFDTESFPFLTLHFLENEYIKLMYYTTEEVQWAINDGVKLFKYCTPCSTGVSITNCST